MNGDHTLPYPVLIALGILIALFVAFDYWHDSRSSKR